MPTENSALAPTLLLFGAGGHGRVVADACLRRAGTWRLMASDRNDTLCEGELLPQVPLMRIDTVSDRYDFVHVAIGDNGAREAESRTLGLEQLLSVLHPRASVSPHARVAVGCFVAAQAIVAPGAVIARGVIVNHASIVDHDVVVGEFTHIAPGATIGGDARIGARVLVGAGAVVLPGLVVCDDAVLGAGAVVCASIDQPGIYVGVPARKIP